MTDKLFHALNMAAGELPPGWIVELCVERGAGWVELYDPDGDRHELEDMPDATLAEQVDAAVLEALRASGLEPRAEKETAAGPSLEDFAKSPTPTCGVVIDDAEMTEAETSPEQQIPDGWCPICGGQNSEHKSGCQDGSEIP